MRNETGELQHDDTERAAARTPRALVTTNEMRLSARNWLLVAVLILLFTAAAPRIWKAAEQFDTGIDYRIPYPLSSDYWLYQRRADELAGSRSIPIIGDSVVWGEYVRKDGTLSHFLSKEAGGPEMFSNCGVNGVFPLALGGLIVRYGQAFHNRKVVVQCNMLWQSSPKADLSSQTEETFNHQTLVPQWPGAIPCYKASAADRLGAFMQTHLGFYGWTNHLNQVYYNQESIPRWTLDEDSATPPKLPNAWRNPLSVIDLKTPSEPAVDPQRGPTSRRHKPWNSAGAEPTHFEWVDEAHSLQWRAMQQLIVLLQQRGNDVLVIVGPFNEHMIAADQLAEFRRIRDAEVKWFRGVGAACVTPEALPSELYADASHPLTEGYALLAQEISTDAVFKAWKARR